MDPIDLVRTSYDRIGARYTADRGDEGADLALLSELEDRLPRGAEVLDLGCGSGRPISARLARSFRVTGVDISQAQIESAQLHVPDGEFICANALDWEYGHNRFDGICSYYAIIHIPRERHRELFEMLFLALKPGGLALLCLGAEDLAADTCEDYYGHPMYWSHFDVQTNLAMLSEIGFQIDRHWLVTDEACPTAQHLFVLAFKPG